MKKAATAILVGALSGTVMAGQIVVVDSWWSIDHAKNAKEWCDKMNPGPNCAHDPTSEAKNYDSTLIALFSEKSACRTIGIFQFYGSYAPVSQGVVQAMKGLHWKLTVDYVPQNAKQRWGLVRGQQVFEGEDFPEQTVTSVCNIVNGNSVQITK